MLWPKSHLFIYTRLVLTWVKYEQTQPSLSIFDLNMHGLKQFSIYYIYINIYLYHLDSFFFPRPISAFRDLKWCWSYVFMNSVKRLFSMVHFPV